MEVIEYQEHSKLIPFYLSRDIEISEDEIPPTFSYIILEGEELVGAVTVSEVEKTFIIQAIAISEKYAGQGIGTRFLKFTIEKIQEYNPKNIILNAKKTKIFENNGFEIIDNASAPVDAYSYCFECPDYQVSCFPKIMQYKNGK